MSDDEDHAVADQLPGGGDRLVGIAEVVCLDQPRLLAEHAASGVEVGQCHGSAAIKLLALPGKGPGSGLPLNIRRPHLAADFPAISRALPGVAAAADVPLGAAGENMKRGSASEAPPLMLSYRSLVATTPS